MTAAAYLESPIIPLTADEIINKDTSIGNFAQTPFYFEALNKAGALSLMMPVEKDPNIIEKYFHAFDGFVFSGGLDVDPDLYGAPRHETANTGSLDNDNMSIQLIRLAYAHKKPVLAICRGAQLLNVALGGKLLQHLPDDIGSMINHKNLPTDRSARHEIFLERSSRLGRIILPVMLEGSRAIETIKVNSYHHQAIDPHWLGRDLRIVARAPDGVTEAVESTKPRHFMVGVQWHPEAMELDESFSKLFEAFTQAVKANRNERMGINIAA